ncbi:MAG: hypothetical protein NTX61_04425 [Bacteroidetes bacterium]|nr:hypothetical protein [Bacteroidota bacterium]
MWHAVDYDPDININYRHEKLKTLGLTDQKNPKHKEEIARMEHSGELDVLRTGDRLFFNHVNFVPVRIKVGLQSNYIAHYYDILGVQKSFPGNRLEIPQPALEVVR